MAGNANSISGLGRSPRGGNGCPLQCLCLGNLLDRGAWWLQFTGLQKNQTWLSKQTANNYQLHGSSNARKYLWLMLSDLGLFTSLPQHFLIPFWTYCLHLNWCKYVNFEKRVSLYETDGYIDGILWAGTSQQWHSLLTHALSSYLFTCQHAERGNVGQFPRKYKLINYSLLF